MHAPPLRYLDTETTGFSAQRGDQLVEVAVLDAAGTILLSTLINPGRPIPAAATKVHGITDAMVRDAPRRHEVLPEILRHVRGCEIVLHNAPFDLAFLPEARAAAERVTCTLAMARSCVPGSKKLGLLADMAGHAPEGAYHRAAADALATRAVHLWLIDRLTQPAASGTRPTATATAAWPATAPRPVAAPPSATPVKAQPVVCCAPDDLRLVPTPRHLCPEPKLRGQPWSADADRHLVGMWCNGADVPRILKEIPRTPLAIFMRLELLGAIPRGSNPYGAR